MEKKQYIQPGTKIIRLKPEGLMITASPGVGGDYNPNQPIEAKPEVFDEEDEELEYRKGGMNLWEE
ncbi:hypothetical protein [Prevotella sp. OH937_COT-195]|uniref:hypothetical protein n=1 Tax=Prevotella sp. OH937_COT-195 TaxID=2491051 RepID=UPI000F654580|nr:hypothetical protein [Prevotella sp. OH937_COT-195]RRC98470.1 hypothetical protein EII32_09175 [Prevotella sp. OH937_COT-195]